MKKILLFLVLIISCVNIWGQLPYSKVLDYGEEQYKENKFKYDKKRNQMILNKSNKTNNVSNVLSGLNGATADIRPHEDDYRMTVQFGESSPSSLNVLFYSDDKFLSLQDWLLNNEIDVREISSGKRTIQQFSYDGMNVEISVEKVSVTATTGQTSQAWTKSTDESYNIYNYTISTGVAPTSEWHSKEAAKKAKRMQGKGKKDMDDMF